MTAKTRSRRKLVGLIAIAAAVYSTPIMTVPARAAAVTVLSGEVSIPQTLVVTALETLQFDPSRSTTVEISGNLVVEGILEMKPEAGVIHTLRFVGVDESTFVGGGMEVLESDRGLWVMGSGKLDIRGQTKTGWNTTGTDSTWSSSDELLVAPTAPGDFGKGGFDSFALGGQVPRADSTLPATEVINLTRNVRIEGTSGGRAHVIIMSSQPQSIRYAAFRFMGPRQPAEGYTTGVIGRYPIHFHHAANGSWGSIVEGNVIRDSGNRAVVPHHSNGITVRDNVAYNVYESAFWWDPGDEHASNDIVYDHNFAGWIRDDPEFRGFELTGFELGRGSGNVARSNVAAGVLGNQNCSGFKWPSKGSGVWSFTANVSHNNACSGIFVWQNTPTNHVVEDFVAYHNGYAGVDHGAYTNDYLYSDLYLFGNEVAGVALHAYAGQPGDGRLTQTWSCVSVADSPTAVFVIASAAPQQGMPVVFNGLSVLNTEPATIDQKALDAGQTLETRVEFEDDADCSNETRGETVTGTGDGDAGSSEGGPDPDAAAGDLAPKSAAGSTRETVGVTTPEPSDDRETGNDGHEQHPKPTSTDTVGVRPEVSTFAAAPAEAPSRDTTWLWPLMTIIAAGLVGAEVRRRKLETHVADR